MPRVAVHLPARLEMPGNVPREVEVGTRLDHAQRISDVYGDRRLWWQQPRRFSRSTVIVQSSVRRSLDRARTWTVPHAEVERERTREAARIGNNLNQIARWANRHKGAAEAVEVLARLVSIERALTALARFENPDRDAR